MNILSEKDLLNKRLENISWGLFLVMLGGLWLVPDQWIPEGSWLIGAGLIMLGLNLVRYIKGIKMSGFTLVLGTIAIFSGISDILRFDLPVFPILLNINWSKYYPASFIGKGLKCSKGEQR